jgi:hypothetical protein
LMRRAAYWIHELVIGAPTPPGRDPEIASSAHTRGGSTTCCGTQPANARLRLAHRPARGGREPAGALATAAHRPI